MDIDRIKKINNLILAICFCLIICLPPADNFFGFTKKINVYETDESTSFPVFSKIKNFKDYFGKINTFYNKNFGMRKLLIKSNAIFKITIFNAPPNKQIILGKNEWIFKDYDKPFALEFNKKQLNNIEKILEKTSDWAVKNNVLYVFAIFPSKNTVYGEYLPYRLPERKQSIRTIQLSELAKNKKNLLFVDPYNDLIESKREGLVYYKTDFHWNNFGAFVAGQKILSEINKFYPNVKQNNLDDYNIFLEDKNYMNTLATMTSIPDYFNKEETIVYRPKGENDDLFFNYRSKKDQLTTIDNKSYKPNMLLVGNSFSRALIPFLYPNFGKSLYFIKNFQDVDMDKDVKDNNIKIIIIGIDDINLNSSTPTDYLNLIK